MWRSLWSKIEGSGFLYLSLSLLVRLRWLLEHSLSDKKIKAQGRITHTLICFSIDIGFEEEAALPPYCAGASPAKGKPKKLTFLVEVFGPIR